MKPGEIRRERQKDAATAARLVGRTIVAAESNACVEGEVPALETWMHGWVLTLDDGTRLSFHTEEHPEGANYGIGLSLTSKPASKRK